MIPLPRHTLIGPDGRRVRVYGELRGGLDADAPRSEATAPHLRWDALSASWIAVSPASVKFFPPHRSARLTKVRASVETATLLFINDTLPEVSAARLAAMPVVPRDEHEPFIVEPMA